LSMLLRVYVYRDLRHGTSCGLTRVSASKDSRAAPNERLFDFMRSTARRSATRLRNGDSEMPTSNAENAEERGEEAAEFVAWNKEPGD
jgi:hypothetical protein